MKKMLSLMLTVVLSLSLFAGCAKSTNDNSKLKIVTTVFSCYDWTREILGDEIENAELTYLLNNGIDLHSYQPTSGDLLSIAKSNLFVYVGGESEEWVSNVLKSNKDINSLKIMDVLKDSVLEEEVVEGMQTPEKEGKEEEEPEYDEHIWTSLRNASAACDEICNQLCKIDGKNADKYKKNNKTYKQKLINLFNQYSEVVEKADTKTIIVADRFPFRYLVEDFGINYYAAFVGCSSESNASYETTNFLSKKLIDENLSCVIVLDGSDKKIAKQVITGSKLDNIKILELNSMQTATVKGKKGDATYLSIAQSNLEVLKEALVKRG